MHAVEILLGLLGKHKEPSACFPIWCINKINLLLSFLLVLASLLIDFINKPSAVENPLHHSLFTDLRIFPYTEGKNITMSLHETAQGLHIFLFVVHLNSWLPCTQEMAAWYLHRVCLFYLPTPPSPFNFQKANLCSDVGGRRLQEVWEQLWCESFSWNSPEGKTIRIQQHWIADSSFPDKAFYLLIYCIFY